MDLTAQIIFDCYKSDGQMSEAAPRAVLRRVLIYTPSAAGRR